MHGSSSRICFPDSEGSTARGHCQSDARTHERGPSGQDSCRCTTRSRWSVVTRHRRELGRAQAPRPLPHSRLRPIEAGGKLPERRGQGPRGPGWPGRRPPRRRLGRPPTTAAVDCRDGPRLRTAQSIRVTGRPGGTVPDGTPATVVEQESRRRRRLTGHSPGPGTPSAPSEPARRTARPVPWTRDACRRRSSCTRRSPPAARPRSSPRRGRCGLPAGRIRPVDRSPPSQADSHAVRPERSYNDSL